MQPCDQMRIDIELGKEALVSGALDGRRPLAHLPFNLHVIHGAPAAGGGALA